MSNKSIETFKRWDQVVDYESDYTEVVLYGKNRKRIATYNFIGGFTKKNLDHYKNKQKVKP